MTTFKQCGRCQQVVEWAPDPIEEYPHMKVYPLACEGGNAPRLCPHRRPPSTVYVETEYEG